MRLAANRLRTSDTLALYPSMTSGKNFVEGFRVERKAATRALLMHGGAHDLSGCFSR